MPMWNEQALIGRIAISLKGRDKGARCVITNALGNGYVMLCDGRLHKAAAQKRKKLKHLQLENGRIQGLGEMLNAPGGTADAAIRRSLAISGAAVHHEDEITGGIACQKPM